MSTSAAERLVSVNLTAIQDTELGRALHKLYYGNTTLLEMAPEHSGYPHNGGEHTFRMRGKRGDVLAYIELLIEEYPFAQKVLSYMFQDIISEKETFAFSAKKYNYIR